jgi:hypothetical protein
MVINRASNDSCRLYIDGTDVTGPYRGSISSIAAIANTLDFRIGIEADDSYPYSGLIDEMVVSFTDRSADWVRLCYMNQKPQDALVQFR